MFYYMITGSFEINDYTEKLIDRRNGTDERSGIATISDEMFEKSGHKRFIFVSSMKYRGITMGLVSSDNSKIDSFIKSFISKLEFKVSDIEYEEITFRMCNRLMSDAERSDYYFGTEVILHSFGVDILKDNFRFRTFCIEETIFRTEDTQSALDSSTCFMCRQPLTEEIERIARGKNKKHVEGHPVHYLIQTDDDMESDRVFNVLIGKLYENHRILSRRCTKIFLSEDSKPDEEDLACWYINSCGGTILINLEFEDETDSQYASQTRNIIHKVCRVMKNHSKDVLTVFRIHGQSEKIKNEIYNKLGHINIVEIKDSKADAADARAYLKKLAGEKKTRTDKKLLGQIEEGKTYLATELNDMYDMWYSNKLKSVIFPQYKDISSVKSNVAKEKVRGIAYDELMEMIGLDRAKSVIKQALDYNKAQKIFADKGLIADRTSMHMVFTGNPGTAKTSVARLFAEIMKDNDVLSEGNLIECGRADLVGPFVGWTAPMVKKKFKEAKGSVLFIDEAYSLVDDRDGMFGDEAINTIVQEMENHRDDVVVVFAGYPDKMEKFLQKNPGLRSRIAYHVPFDDYNVDELCDIADLIAKKKDLVLADDARAKLREVFAVAMQDDDYGNGRYVRNILEKAKMKQASRLVAMDYSSVTSEDVRTIVASDIEMPVKKAKQTRIGFCA